MELADVTEPGDRFHDAPTLPVFAEVQNPSYPEALLVYVWCPRCMRAHQHGLLKTDHRIQHRAAHCTGEMMWGNQRKLTYQKTGYFIERHDPVIEMRYGKPVLNVVGRDGRGRAIVPCPFCHKSHRHHIYDNAEWTLKKSHCPKFPGEYFVRLRSDLILC